MFPGSYARTVLFILAYSILAGAQQKAAQDAPKRALVQASTQVSPNPPAPDLRVTTRMVVVDVVATDNKGAPIRDLQADDFTVQEEGQEQPIRMFTFHQPDNSGGGAVASTPTPVKPSKLPEGYFSNTPQYKTSGALNVLLLDTLNSTLPNQAAMRDAMIKLLEKLPPGEPIAIYLLGNKLTLVQDFTSDAETLKKAIAGVKRQGSKSLENAAGTTRMDEMPVGSVAFDTMMSVPSIRAKLDDFHDQQIAAQADFRVRLSLDAFNSLARSLAGYPGRKNLIWISEAFPFTIVDKPMSNTGTALAKNARDFSADIAVTANLLSNAQVAIYPINVQGISGNADFSVGNDPNPMGKPAIITSTLDNDAGTNMNRESENRTASRSTMNDLAEKTGGRAFYNSNNIEAALRHSLEDGSTYYTLGYYPTNKIWDGRFRRITVKAARPGARLHYRLGYFALEPQSYAKLDTAHRNEDMARALSLKFPASTALLFQAAVQHPSENKVLITYAVDAHALTFESGSDGLQHASVDCAVIVYSTKGETVQALSNTMVAALKPDEYKRVMEKSFPCRQSFDLAPGQYVFRLGVRDARTGLIGTLDAPVTIAPASSHSETKPTEKKP